MAKGGWLLFLFLGWLLSVLVAQSKERPEFSLALVLLSLWAIPEIGVRFASGMAILNGRHWGRMLYVGYAPLSLVVNLNREGIDAWDIGHLLVYALFCFALLNQRANTFFGPPVTRIGANPLPRLLGSRLSILAYTLLLLAGVAFAYTRTPVLKANSILEADGFANLPSSASEVCSYSWSGLFTGESFVKFKAEDGAIQEFLNRSRGLQAAQVFSVPSEEAELKLELLHISLKHGRFPKWFNPAQPIRGKLFDLSPGLVVVNEADGFVYVWLIRG